MVKIVEKCYKHDLTIPQQKLIKQICDGAVYERCKTCRAYPNIWTEVSGPQIKVAKNLQRKQLVIFQNTSIGVKVLPTYFFWEHVRKNDWKFLHEEKEAA